MNTKEPELTDGDTSTTAETGTAPISNDERTWAVLTHVGTIFTAFVAPLIVLLITNSGALGAHAKEDINLVISCFIYSMILVVLTAATGGVLGVIALPLIWIISMAFLVMLIIAAVKASNNDLFRHKLILRFVK